MTIDKLNLPRISLPKLPKTFAKKKEPGYTPVETEVLSPNIPEPAPGQEVVKIYTYKDEKGISHYTDKQPDRDEYKVIFMPVSKGEKKSALSKFKEKVNNFSKNIKREGTLPRPDEPSARKDPSDFSVPNIYTHPTKAINEAMDLKKQVEAQYKHREQMMEK